VKIATEKLNALAFSLIGIGILLGIFDVVRTGSFAIAIGAGAIIISKYLRSNRRRKIELILPLAMASLLFVVALTLPNAK
jgi:hypothetical protein